MSEALRQYRSLESDLIYVRWQHEGFESEEEEPILDAMEQLWHELDPDEQQMLYSEGTKSLIRNSKSIPTNIALTDQGILEYSGSSAPVRSLKTVA